MGGLLLQIFCCKRKFSTRDPETFHYFDYYQHNPTKNKDKGKNFLGYVEELDIKQERTFVLNCPHCAEQRLRVLRFGNGGLLVRILKIDGEKNVLEHMSRIKDTMQEIILSCPVKTVPFGQHVQLFYNHPDTLLEATILSLDGHNSRGTYTKEITESEDEKLTFITLSELQENFTPEYINLKIA